jgi:hypothetical protein
MSPVSRPCHTASNILILVASYRSGVFVCGGETPRRRRRDADTFTVSMGICRSEIHAGLEYVSQHLASLSHLHATVGTSHGKSRGSYIGLLSLVYCFPSFLQHTLLF